MQRKFRLRLNEVKNLKSAAGRKDFSIQ